MAEAAENSFDVVIVDSTDPVGPATGLFNEAFYRCCCRVLKPDGLLVQQSESPLLHVPLLQSMHQALRTAGFQTVRTLQFPLAIYPSGWWTATIAGNRDLTSFREQAVENKSFPTHYYNAAIHTASFALPSFLQEALRV
jgi:spermidine synthase